MRPVHAEEALRIEALLEGAERELDEVPPPADVQRHVVVGRLESLDVAQTHREQPSAVAHEQPGERPARVAEGGARAFAERGDARRLRRRATEGATTYGMDGMAAASGPVSEAPIV